MNNYKWKRLAHRCKKMICEDVEKGDLLYDVLTSPKDDGEDFIDVGEILEPSTTYISDDIQESLTKNAKKVGGLLTHFDETLFDSLPIQQYSRYYKVLNDAINTIWFQLLGLYDCLDMDLMTQEAKEKNRIKD